MPAALKTVASVVAIALTAFVFAGCDENPAGTDTQSNPTPPPWMTLHAGTRALIVGAGDPHGPGTVWICNDRYEAEQFSENNALTGCNERNGGVIVTLLKSGVRAEHWVGAVAMGELLPVHPKGVAMECTASSDPIFLYSGQDSRVRIDLRDRPVDVVTTHQRRAQEWWGVSVRIVHGYGTGRSGYIKNEDLASCVLQGTTMQPLFQNPTNESSP